MKTEEISKLELKILEAWGYGTYSKITLNNARVAAKIALELAQEAYEFGIDRTNDIRPFSEFIKNYD